MEIALVTTAFLGATLGFMGACWFLVTQELKTKLKGLGFMFVLLGLLLYSLESAASIEPILYTLAKLAFLVAGGLIIDRLIRLTKASKDSKASSKPKDWPQWLKEANTENCEVEIRDGCVIWKRGRWISGAWKGGIWEDGVWFDGVWESGTWKRGTWHNGIWRGGTWGRGHWHQGTWESGVWKDGIWDSGVWQSGVWRDGVWHGGVWKQGTWEGGHNKVPRFGWALLSSGLIFGYRGPTPTIMWASGWEPHLKDMEPEKADEYRALLLWKQMREAPKSKAASLWDHIEEEL